MSKNLWMTHKYNRKAGSSPQLPGSDVVYSQGSEVKRKV